MSDIFIVDSNNKTENQEKQTRRDSLLDKINSYLLLKQSLSVKQKVMFFRLLAVMLNSGITLSKALLILQKQEKKEGVYKYILTTFVDKIKEGKGLSEIMDEFGSSFSGAEIGMVESGEKTGKLNTSLLDLSAQVEKIASINGKLKSAMMYPAMIIVVLIGVVTVLMVMVVPKLLEIFDSKESLPASTQLLISVSDFFVGYWWVLLFLMVGGIFFVQIWGKTSGGRYYLDKIILKIPIFGDITRKIILSKFSRVLSGMLKSGVSIVEALRITSEALGNEVYRQRVLLLRDDIKRGLKIYESLEDDPLFPGMMVSMIQVGEQSAKVDEVILKVADFYDEEVDNTIGVINKLLEPIIIVTMATIVGFIAVAIMQPIMNLADTVSNG